MLYEFNLPWIYGFVKSVLLVVGHLGSTTGTDERRAERFKIGEWL
jgi:hypothetical protein